MTERKIFIAPSLLAADFSQLDRQIETVEEAGADWLHLDVMDGRFVPPITFGDIICKAANRCTKMPLDTHLMIVEPERQIESFAKAGTEYLTVHVEACPHLHRVIQEIHAAELKAGVTLNPATPIDTVSNVVGEVDLILVMSVNPGWGAQKFLPIALSKIRTLAEWRQKHGFHYLIEVDGGIDPVTAKLAVEAGADVLVAGTAVFKGDIAENIESLRAAVSR